MKLENIGRHAVTGDTLWSVVDDVRVKIGPRMYVQVPAGYVSNLGTIPRWARWCVSPDAAPKPFVVHDFMANESHVHTDEELDSGYSRWIADAVLYELMVRDKLPSWKCWIVWFAVRLYVRSRGIR